MMGEGATFAEAFAKAQLAAGVVLPRRGKAFVSVRDADKPRVAAMTRRLVERGFEIYATRGTAAVLDEAGVPCQRINKVTEGRPNVVDMTKNDEVNLIINTAEGKQAIKDSYAIRREALQHKVSYTTTMAGAEATSLALQYLEGEEVRSLQQLHKEIA